MCAYFVQPSKLYSNMEWMMDSSVSNHMNGLASLLNYYDTKKHTTQKVSIRNGNHVSVLGSGNVDVPNGTLEDVFHV